MLDKTDLHDQDFVKLNVSELRAMAALDPTKLLNWIRDSGSLFMFGVERFEEDPDRWGGLYRLTINRNIELHFVPDFNTAMLDIPELPRFSIMPHPHFAGTSADRQLPRLEEDDDEDDRTATIFYVMPEDFVQFCEELDEFIEEWNANPPEKVPLSFPFLPESYFRSFDLFQWIIEKVLTYPIILQEKKFDGRLGYPMTPKPNENELEDIPPPYISDEDDEEWEDDDDDAVLTNEDIDRIEEARLEERRRQEGY